MSVKGYQATKDRESREKVAKEDREQRERESKRDFIKGIIPKVQFKFGKGSASNSNHPEWYKKWMQKYLGKFTSLPTYVDVTVGRVPVTGGYGSAGVLFTGYNSSTHQLVNSVRYGAGRKLVNTTYNGQVHVAVHEFLPHLGYVDQSQIDSALSGGGMPGSWRDKYPINITTLQTYGNMGKVNSRAIDADISIYGMYIVAAVDLYAFAAELKCVLDVYAKYQINNNAMPRAILLAKGYNPDAFLAHIADWRKVYAQVSEMLNTTIPIPANLTLLARRIWLNSVIIKDADNDKAPLMTFKQVSYGLLSEDGTEIEYKSFLDYPSGGIGSGHPVRILTPDDCLAWFQYASRRLTQSDDFTTLIANMRAAVGSFYVLPNLDDKANIISINDDVKLQMQNIVTLPSYYGDKFMMSKDNDLPVGHGILNAIDQWKVFQNADGSMQQETNFVVATLTSPTTASDINAWFKFQFGMYACTEMATKLNSFVGWDDDKFLIATRLHPIMRGYNILKDVSGTYYPELHLVLGACGTEIVTATNIVGSYPDPQNNNARFESYIGRLNTDILTCNTSSSGGTSFVTSMGYPENIYTMLPQIDGLYPIMTTAVNTSIQYGTASGTFSGTIRFASITQLDDYIYVEDIDLASIHEICIKSEYYLDEADFGKGFIKR